MRPGEETPAVRRRGRPSWRDLPRGELQDHWDARLDWTPSRTTLRQHAALVALRDQAIPKGAAVRAREALIRRRAREAQDAYDTARRAGDPQTIAEAKRKRDAAPFYDPSDEETAVYLAEALPSRPVGGRGEWPAAAHAVAAADRQLRRELEHVNEDLRDGIAPMVATVVERLVRALAPGVAAAAVSAARLLAKHSQPPPQTKGDQNEHHHHHDHSPPDRPRAQ